MTRVVISLAVNFLAFGLVIGLVPSIRFVGGSAAGILVAAIISAAVLSCVTVVEDRIAGGWTRRRRLVATGALAVVVAATWLLVLTQLGFGFVVGTLPAVRSLSALRAWATGTALLAAGPLILELLRPRLESIRRAGSVWTDRDRRAILAIFFLSGMAGLVYEVVWARQLVLVFGNTTQAISAILTGYFGGIAIGSVLGGRVADRVRRPLRLYGILELTLVVVVLITPLLFRGLHELYRSSYVSLAGQPELLQLIRYGLALVALAPATILMGATLPTLSRHLARTRTELGTSFGALYAANTFGAVIGTILAGIVLIELFGLTLTLVLGAAASFSAGAAAVVLDRRRKAAAEPAVVDEPAAAPAAAASPAPPSGPAPDLRRIAVVVAFVSGATSLGYQLLWTRLLASGSGNSTYIFTLILTLFLIGIACGAAVVSSRIGRLERPIAVLGSVQFLIAAIVLAGTVILSGHTPGTAFLIRVVVVVLPATIAIGATLPMASSLVGTGAERIGRDTGLLLAANTIGAICGTFLVPFLLIPTIGSLRAIILLAVLNVVTGVALTLRGRDVPASARRALGALGAGLAAVAIVGLVMPNPLTVDPGATRLDRSGGLLASAEDEIAAVQAGKVGTERRLLVGGTGMTRLSVDTKLMAYLPLMIRPDAHRLLVIAFGMGSTYRAGLVAGLSVDGIELVPSVPAMLRYFYADADQVLADPNGRLTITDGRNYVELSQKTYDLIAVDPPPPIESSGTSVLYSREFYEAASRRLNDGGLMMEWIPASQSVDDFRSHVRTFKSVFPNVTLAFSPHQLGVYMLGSSSPIPIEPSNVQAVLARNGILADLVDTGDNQYTSIESWAGEIEKLPWISGSRVDAFGANAPLITDDRPVPEYFLLRRLLAPPSPQMTEANLLAAMPRD